MVQVTISGADDKVNPDDMVALAAEFPFVEWGILFSMSRTGTPRYPSQRWIDDVAMRGLKLSAHLCGQYARDLGRGELTAPIPPGFSRLQINTYDPAWFETIKALTAVSPLSKPGTPSSVGEGPLRRWEIILPARTLSTWDTVGYQSTQIYNGRVLFDPSGGLGLAPTEWPRARAANRGAGYAGGITPKTFGKVVSMVLGPRMNTVPAHVWLDMESGVRDANDALDLDLVREVLKVAAPYNRGAW
jgi:hypothetical protein